MLTLVKSAHIVEHLAYLRVFTDEIEAIQESKFSLNADLKVLLVFEVASLAFREVSTHQLTYC